MPQIGDKLRTLSVSAKEIQRLECLLVMFARQSFRVDRALEGVLTGARVNQSRSKIAFDLLPVVFRPLQLQSGVLNAPLDNSDLTLEVTHGATPPRPTAKRCPKYHRSWRAELGPNTQRHDAESGMAHLPLSAENGVPAHTISFAREWVCLWFS